MKVQEVLEAAKRAKDAGSTRFCMGAAWRELGNKKNAFNHILDMVKGVNGMGLEVCCTLGMLNAEQARQLKDAGLTRVQNITPRSLPPGLTKIALKLSPMFVMQESVSAVEVFLAWARKIRTV
jgi:hypothetical protein